MLRLCICILICAVAVTSSPFARQADGPPCTDHRDCIPSGLSVNVSTNLVECLSDGRCSCSDCFLRNETANRCYLMTSCLTFDEDTRQCSDSRKSQLTAFLLTFFLIWTGAANFYIDRLEFAIPQLIFGIVLLVLGCVGRCIKECVKDSDSGKVIVCCFIGIPYLVLSIFFFAWWIGDLVIFGTNQRDDGDGCPLIDNL